MFQIKGSHPVFRAWLMAFCFFLLTAMSSYAQKPSGQINLEDARSLVIATLQARGYDINSAKLGVEEGKDSYFPNFYHFEVYFDTPARLAAVGFFAVDPKTADVWDKGFCKRIKSKQVRDIQKTLRLRYQLDKEHNISVPPCREGEVTGGGPDME
jgi:hypothetical protein